MPRRGCGNKGKPAEPRQMPCPKGATALWLPGPRGRIKVPLAALPLKNRELKEGNRERRPAPHPQTKHTRAQPPPPGTSVFLLGLCKALSLDCLVPCVRGRILSMGNSLVRASVAGERMDLEESPPAARGPWGPGVHSSFEHPAPAWAGLLCHHSGWMRDNSPVHLVLQSPADLHGECRSAHQAAATLAGL